MRLLHGLVLLCVFAGLTASDPATSAGENQKIITTGVEAKSTDSKPVSKDTKRTFTTKDFTARVVVLRAPTEGGRVHTYSLSGFYIGDGYVATNRHFGFQGDEYKIISITVYFESAVRSTKGHKVVKDQSVYDKRLDIAFLKLKEHHFRDDVPNLGEYTKLKPGDVLSAFGSTRSDHWLTREGVVRSVSEVLTHSTAISPGFSGGMVVKDDRIVGMQSQGKFKTVDGFIIDNEAIEAYAIPIDIVIEIFNKLRTK